MTEDFVGEEFTVTGTSRLTADVSDVVLTQKTLTRLVVRPELVVNQRDAEASVKACLMHQKRHSTNEPWMDADSFNLATLRRGQEVRLSLDAGETRKLYDLLTSLYKLPIGGWSKSREQHLAVVDTDVSRIVSGHEKQLIEELLEQEGEEFWSYIEELRPGLLAAAALKKQHETRRAALDLFEEQFIRDEWEEGDWQAFFESNKWIFGYSLAHQILIAVGDQPHFGGTTVSGKGGQRGDFLMATEAAARFVVLVEIKVPGSPLVEGIYRNKVHKLGEELMGGVAQLQSNCRTWVLEGSRQEENASELEANRIYTYEPKGILVVGNTAQLDDRHKRATFELFRRELRNPDIVTFDELLDRARFIVEVDQDRA